MSQRKKTVKDAFLQKNPHIKKLRSDPELSRQVTEIMMSFPGARNWNDVVKRHPEAKKIDASLQGYLRKNFASWKEQIQRDAASIPDPSLTNRMMRKMIGDVALSRDRMGRKIAENVAALITAQNQPHESDPPDKTPPVELLAYLTRQQGVILAYLWSNPNATKRQLHAHVWPAKCVQDASLDTAVQRLNNNLAEHEAYNHITVEVSGEFVILHRPDKSDK